MPLWADAGRMFWWRGLSSHGWDRSGGIIPGLQNIMEDLRNIVWIGEGGANVLVLGTTKPPSLLPPPMFGLRAPRNQV